MRQFIRKIGITWLLLLLLVGMSVPVVYAENGNEAIGGSSEKVGYFTVVTEPGAKESYLDFRQTIGVMGQKPNSVAGFFFPNRARMYERYLITAERLENDRVVSTEEYQTELKDFRLNLAPGATYRVKVVPLYIAWVEKMKDPSYARRRERAPGMAVLRGDLYGSVVLIAGGAPGCAAGRDPAEICSRFAEKSQKNPCNTGRKCV